MCLIIACAAPNRRVDAGRLTVANGVTYDGRRPFTGVATSTRLDGGRRATRYVDGRRDGADSVWFASGRLAEVRTWTHDRETGRHRGWFESGAPRFDFTYVDGRLEGRAQEWFASGKPYRDFNYTAGQEAGAQRMWFADGTLRASYVVRDGRRYGLIGAKGCVTPEDSVDPSGLPYYVDSTRTPRWDVPRSAAHRVGDFTLVDQRGQRVTAASVAGKVYVASFFYTTCRSLCPTVRSQLATVRDAFRGDTMVAILSHTVAPEADDVPALAHYARLNAIGDAAKGGAWHLLTGPRATIDRLARTSYFVELADTTGNTRGTLRHTETLVLVDGAGHIRGMYEGSLAYEVGQLVTDMRRLRSTAE